jgi:hypothetical protein
MDAEGDRRRAEDVKGEPGPVRIARVWAGKSSLEAIRVLAQCTYSEGAVFPVDPCPATSGHLRLNVSAQAPRRGCCYS